MTTLYEVIPGLTPSAQDITEAELLIEQIVQANYPDLDTRIGTAIRDLLIRPAATLAAILQLATTYYFEQSTIKGVTDNTPTAFVDALLSNWFLNRQLGTNAVISARLYFARQKDITLTTNIFFSPDGQLQYFPTTSIIIPAAALTFDSNQNEYYYDINLTASAEGTAYNISSGSLLYFSNFDPYFLHAEINYLVSTSTLTESNSEFITRAQTAISTRNLINVPSISSNLLAAFPILGGVTSIGFGDPEMVRDQLVSYVPSLTPPGVLVHVGGCVDIYCRLPLTSSIVQYTADSSGNITVSGPVYSWARSSITGGSVADTIPFYQFKGVSNATWSGGIVSVTTGSPHGYSSGQAITIIGAVQTGYNGTFTITVTGANTFTYAVAATLVTPATGTITSNVPTPYTISNQNTAIQTLTSLTSSGTVATATLANHGVTANRYVTISGASPAGYNGEVFVTAVTANTFTYNLAGSLSSPATGTISVTAVIPAQDFGFSNNQALTFSFGIGYLGGTASFVVNYFQDIDGLQSYLGDSNNKVICANYLARGYNLYLLDMTVTGYNTTPPDTTICTDTVVAYLGALAPGQLFVMADMLSALANAGITSVQTPVTTTYKYYNRDVLIQGPKTGTITDYLDPHDRTALFMLNSMTTTSTNV